MRVPFVIATRIVRQLTNDRRTIGMIVVVPIIITFVFGYAFQGETYNNPIIIVNLDEGNSLLSESLGDAIVRHIKNDDRVNVIYELDSIKVAKEFVLNKTVEGFIFIPANLSNSLNPMLNLTETIIVLYDEAEPAIGRSIFGTLSDSLNDAFDDVGVKSPISIDKEFAWGDKEIVGLNISLPGVMGYIILFLTLLLTVLLSVREDLEGTKIRFFSAPINRWQIISGYILGMSVFATIISLVVLIVSVGFFNAEVRGSLPLVLAFVLYFALGTVFLALFLARVARNEFQAVQMAIIVAIPSIAISGFMVPVNSLPDFLAIISNIVPLTYAIEGLKTLMLRGGTGIEDIWFEVFALTIYMVVTFIAAVYSSKETVA